MNATTNQQTQLSTLLWAVVDFCQNRGSKNTSIHGMERQQLFRYVSFCYFAGKLACSWENNQLEAVVFYWPDFRERIESNYEEGRSQFAWEKVRKGDSMFIADVIGSRKSVAKGYQALIEKFPHVISVPMFTYRHGKLVQLYGKQLERFLFGKEIH